MTATPTEYKTFDLDGITVTYILSNSPHELSESQYDRIRFKRQHLFYGRFTINGKEYWYECVLADELLADVPHYMEFIKHNIKRQINKIKDGEVG